VLSLGPPTWVALHGVEGGARCGRVAAAALVPPLAGAVVDCVEVPIRPGRPDGGHARRGGSCRWAEQGAVSKQRPGQFRRQARVGVQGGSLPPFMHELDERGQRPGLRASVQPPQQGGGALCLLVIREELDPGEDLDEHPLKDVRSGWLVQDRAENTSGEGNRLLGVCSPVGQLNPQVGAIAPGQLDDFAVIDDSEHSLRLAEQVAVREGDVRRWNRHDPMMSELFQMSTEPAFAG
jgi:hypothetical protein